MNYIDFKYINLISPRLSKYKVTQSNPFRANFRCPLCGDSQKNVNKKRGWIIDYGQSARFFCHNCNASLSLSAFFKSQDQHIWSDWMTEKKMDKLLGFPKAQQSRPQKEEKPKEVVTDWRRNIVCLGDLNSQHIANEYCSKRLIPSEKSYKLLYADKFNKWTNSIIPDKLQEKFDEPRLVFPFLDEDEQLLGFTGRSFEQNPHLRYITIMLRHDYPKIFGLDSVDWSRDYYVTEGAIDSLFLDNAIAMAGASMSLPHLKNKNKAIFIFDNEPRNKEVHKQMERIIACGFRIMIWPKSVSGQKDINDMVLAKHDITSILKNDVYKGLMARQKFSEWRKI